MTGVFEVGGVGIVAVVGSVGDMVGYSHALLSAVKVCDYAQSCSRYVSLR